MKRFTSFTALALALTLVVSTAHANHAPSPAAKGAPVAAATPAAKAAPAGPAKSATPPPMGKTPTGPSKSSTPPAQPPAPKGPTGKTTTPPSQVTETMKVDLNTATRDELMKIPGIGTATVDKIVAGRPFKAKSDLLAKGVVNKAQYGKLAPYVIAKQK